MLSTVQKWFLHLYIFMKWFMILLLAFSFCIVAQEYNMDEEDVMPMDTENVTEEAPVREEAPAAEEAPAKDLSWLKNPQPSDESRGFWMNLTLWQIIFFLTLIAQLIERFLEILFSFFKKLCPKGKLLLAVFLGMIIAMITTYLLQAYVIFDHIPAMENWNTWGKIAILAFIIYSLTQPLHKLANPKLLQTVCNNLDK